MTADLGWLIENNFTINETNSDQKPLTTVSFLGFSVSADGIKSDDRLVEKVRSTKIPANHKESDSLYGLANCYGLMIPNFATKMIPLNDLRIQDFEQTDLHEKCFWSIKQEICSKQVVQSYSLDREVSATTDASEEAVGGFSHKKDIQWSIYVSRKLSSAERNYTNIKREALAIVFETTRLKQCYWRAISLYKQITNPCSTSSRQTERYRRQHQLELPDGLLRWYDWLRVKICVRRADLTCVRSKQTAFRWRDTRRGENLFLSDQHLLQRHAEIQADWHRKRPQIDSNV